MTCEIGFFCFAYEASHISKKRINAELVSRYILGLVHMRLFWEKQSTKKSIDYVQHCTIDNVCTILENLESFG